MVWFVLVPAGCGFTLSWPSLITGAAIAGSMFLLACAARTLPIGTAYAVWVCIGALGTAVGGVVLHREAITLRVPRSWRCSRSRD